MRDRVEPGHVQRGRAAADAHHGQGDAHQIGLNELQSKLEIADSQNVCEMGEISENSVKMLVSGSYCGKSGLQK